jgi:thiol:disulfide interchange protein
MNLIRFWKFFTLAVSIFLSFEAESQIEQPVKWGFSTNKVSSGEIELLITANIEEGWHIYGLSMPDGGPVATSFNIRPSKGYNLEGGMISIKPAQKVYDKIFNMEIELYEKQVEFKQLVRLNIQQDTVRGTVTYMACNNLQCTPPDEIEFIVPLNEKSVLKHEPNKNNSLSGLKGIQTNTSNMDSHSLWGILIAGILGGFAAFFMPCIFPMLPLTVSYFTKNGKRGNALGQSMLYGGFIITIYVALGLLVTLIFGADALNDLSTNGFFNLFFFVLLVIFAFSFLGAFELTLPSSWGNKLDAKADKGGILGLFFMAATLAIVSFSCTGPIIGTLLVETATKGTLLGPAIGMFGFSFALALPFTFFSLFPSWLQSLPKSGGWLNSIKVTLGFLELGLALKFLSNVDLAYHWKWLDREVFLVLWISISGLLAMYLLGKLRLPHDGEAKSIGSFRLSIAIVMVAFTLYLLPGLWGAPLKVVAAFLPPPQTQDFDLYSRSLSGAIQNISENSVAKHKYSDLFDAPYGLNAFFDLDEALAYAKKINKPVIIDFTGHACVNCRKMESTIWPDSRVIGILRNNYVLVQLFVDDKTPLPQNEYYTSSFSGKKTTTIGGKWSDLQASKYNTNSQPYYVLLGLDGTQLVTPQGANYDIPKFVEYLNSGLKKFSLQ